MPHAPTPWIGLAALAAMFIIPFLPIWLLKDRGPSGTGPSGTSAATATPPGPTTTPVPQRSMRPIHCCMVSFVGAHRQPSLNAGRGRGLLHDSALVAYPDRQGSAEGASGRTVRTHPFAPYGRARPGETPVRTALALDC
jgi:hypothetical protein